LCILHLMFRQNKILLSATIISIAVALYCYNPFLLYFQNDDFIHIPLSAKGVLLQHNTFRPVCDISIMLDYWIWGKNAWGYHFTNLLLHIASCIILYFFLRVVLTKYFQTQNSATASLVVSALFFIYGMHSEAIFWILGRSAILATIFSLLCLLCFLKKYNSRKFIAGYILFFILSLFTYESSWVILLYCLLLGVVEVLNKKTSIKKEAFHVLSLVLIFSVFLGVRYYFIHEVLGNYESGNFLSNNYSTLLKNFGELVFRSFFPPFNNVILTICFMVLAVATVIILFRQSKAEKRKSMILCLFFFISLLPYASLGVDTHGTEGERFLYFPSIIACILYVHIINTALINNRFKYGLIIFLIVCHLSVLLINSNNYRFAGNVNKTIINELSKTTGGKEIYAIDLPQAQNGALIMRTGFPEMLQWMFDNKFDTAIVCSQRSELKPLRNPYSVIYTKNIQQSCANPDSTNSVILRFTDSTLQISR
jgi:hypothetical protein